MRTEETRAIVLRLQDLGESDRLVWLLTERHGRLSAVARGARKSRKRFGGDLDLFQLITATVSLRPRGALHSLTDCRANQVYPLLRADVERFATASVFVELVSHLTREGDPDPALFAQTAASLATLAAPGPSPDQSCLAAGLVGLLSTAGFLGDLSACASCGEDLTAGRFAVVVQPEGRVACERCGAEGPAARRLPVGEAGTLASWQRGRWQGARASEALVAIVLTWVHHLLGRRLRSEDFALGLLRAPGGPP